MGQPMPSGHPATYLCDDEQVSAGEVGEKERRNGSIAVVGGGSEEMREMRNGLMLVPAGQEGIPGLGC